MTDNELTYEIRGAIFDVYNTLGPGLLESVCGICVICVKQQSVLYTNNSV